MRRCSLADIQGGVGFTPHLPLLPRQIDVYIKQEQ